MKTTVQYQTAVSDAIELNDFSAVELYNRRIAQLGNDTNEKVVYRAAIQLEEKGKIDEAYAQMQTIANPDELGFLLAHLWIADRFFTKKLAIPDSNQSKINSLIIRHLEQALAQESGQVRATLVLAMVHLSEGNSSRSKEILANAKGLFQDPIDLMRVSKLYHRLGDPGTAAKYVRLADDAAKNREQMGSLPIRHYIGKAEAELALGKLDAAIRTATAGLAAYPSDQGLANYVVRLRIQKYDLTKSLLSPSEMLRQVVELNQMSPNNPEALQRAADLMEIAETAVAAERIVVEASERPDAPLVHIFNLLGSGYAAQRRFDESRTSLERSLDINSEMPDILNNLSWLYSNHEPINVQQALEFAQKAVHLDPSNPHYRDTLGHIYVQLERWSDAANELRQAVNGMPTNRGTHSALSKCYEHLNQPGLAAQHRELANE
jgi:tetratricopeptide (TPR) repeat protein